MVLHDVGFSDEEARDWLIGEEDSLGTTPIAALRAGRKAEVAAASRRRSPEEHPNRSTS
ncbi:Rv2175c family DNA-binding protein [Agromyces mediolanus]|uniref:Rv2175c family DNA-binding protein n=1 Tax=Agromyces mediolanus TaxID=41986 RepID=UPI003609509D